MNLNKALIISFCFLVLLVVIFVIQLNRSKKSGIEYVLTDDEILITHILCVPEIIRSYEKIKDEYGKKNTLFFRYANSSCGSCINDYLEDILALQEEIGKEHVWIFPAYPDDRGSRIQLSTELAKYNYRNIPADSLHIPVYHGNPQSYFAWINNEGEIEMVFIPDINKPQYTRNYFQEVKRIINGRQEVKTDN